MKLKFRCKICCFAVRFENVTSSCNRVLFALHLMDSNSDSNKSGIVKYRKNHNTPNYNVYYYYLQNEYKTTRVRFKMELRYIWFKLTNIYAQKYEDAVVIRIYNSFWKDVVAIDNCNSIWNFLKNWSTESWKMAKFWFPLKMEAKHANLDFMTPKNLD